MAVFFCFLYLAGFFFNSCAGAVSGVEGFCLDGLVFILWVLVQGLGACSSGVSRWSALVSCCRVVLLCFVSVSSVNRVGLGF